MFRDARRLIVYSRRCYAINIEQALIHVRAYPLCRRCARRRDGDVLCADVLAYLWIVHFG